MKALPIAILSLILLTFSCDDHVIPNGNLLLKTLPFEHVNTTTIFKIQVDHQGKKPVIEYGIVYTAYFRGAGNHKLDPTVDDIKIIFDTPFMLGINQFNYTKDFINGKTFFHYRAYAILDDGSVIYGNRISFTI